jgi:hypothetical protein
MKKIFLLFGIFFFLFLNFAKADIVSVNSFGTNSSVANPSNTIEGFFIAYQDISLCIENWSCSAFSACSGGIQTRICTDLNSCGTTANKPVESQSCATPISPGGGGGGGGIFGFLFPKPSSFSVNVDEIKVSATPGKVVTKSIIITNNLNQSISIDLSQQSLDNFLSLKDNSIILNPRESRAISLDFVVREGTKPDLYLGKLTLTNPATQEKMELLTVVEVVSEGALLDVSAEIQPEYLKVAPNHDILAKITMFNVQTTNIKRDISLEYIIKDENGKKILEDRETVSIETQTSWVKRFAIPSGTPYGKYVLYVKATTMEGRVASATDTFEVVAPQTEVIYILLIVLIIVIMTIVIYFSIKQKNKPNKGIKEVNLKDILKE